MSDPAARRRYDEDGSVDAGDGLSGAPWDPAVYFAMVFGGEGFVKYVGDLQVGQMLKPPDQDSGDQPDAAEVEFVQRRRAVRLAKTLAEDGVGNVGVHSHFTFVS